MEINADAGGGTNSEEIAKIAIDAGENYREYLFIVQMVKLRMIV